MKNFFLIITILFAITSCAGPVGGSSGGELTGVRGRTPENVRKGP